MAAEDKSAGPYRVLCGRCPDEECQAKLFFPSYDTSIECTSCGQRHERHAIKATEEVTNPEVMIHNILRNMLLGKTKPKKGADSVKVLGLSNFQCKMISPLLTRYGMDHEGKARLLSEMGQGVTFDCAKLGDRAFQLEPENIDVIGYGRDRTGSMNYLKDTLFAIAKCNNDEERLLPIHADGDGHCLVHAVSRALVGRELFWHALRENLKEHFKRNLHRYQMLFKDFIDKEEWQDIIEECDPEFIPPDGEPLGLRNIHIFGLANVLHRPVILLDSISGIQCSGDYSGVFLPGLLEPSECRNKAGVLNKPLCLAWSSMGRNHYIGLVGVKGRPAARLPGWMMPKAWGMPQEQVSRYIDLDLEGCCVIGGDKGLQDKYMLRLVRAMEAVFQEQFDVSPALVADVHQYVYKSTGMVGVKPEIVLGETQRQAHAKRLYRCLTCEAVSIFNISSEWLCPGGKLYTLAEESHGPLQTEKNYSFPLSGLICAYDPQRDMLVPDWSRSKMTHCQWCQGTQMRLVDGNGTIQYINGDRTATPTSSSRCQCGFKHYWEGKEYDNLPEIFPVSLEWNGKVVGEKVVWFQFESDPALNSNVFEEAQRLVQKHFPGAFGSERLVQKVVDSILRQTAQENQAEGAQSDINPADDPLNWAPDTASKIILTGRGKKSRNLHKEELTKSDTEKAIHQRVQQKAAAEQHKKSKHEGGTPSPKTSPHKISTKPASQGAPQSPTSKLQTSRPAGDLTTNQNAVPAVGQQQVKQKKVRVSTSDGRQLTLSLEGDTTYASLQAKLHADLSVPPERQRIKHGFPPRELVAPSEDKQTEPLPIQHGDRLTVEILPDTSQPAAPPAAEPQSMETSAPAGWGGPVGPAADTTSMLIKGLTELQESSADSLDTSIASLGLMASLTGRDMWSYVQTMPHLFTIGGLFYEQVKRDLGFSEGKHCTLPSVPGKVFRYSSSSDSLELCLEPHGHFPVAPGVEERVLGAAAKEPSSTWGKSVGSAGQKTLGELKTEEVRQALTVGSSGMVLNKTMNYPQVQHAFSGQGHTLAGPSPTVTTAQAHTPAEPQPTTSSSDTAVAMDTSEKLPVQPEEATFRRVGPGCTVLSTQRSPGSEAPAESLVTSDSNAALLQSLAATIQAAVEDTANLAQDTSIEQGMGASVEQASVVEGDMEGVPGSPVDAIKLPGSSDLSSKDNQVNESTSQIGIKMDIQASSNEKIVKDPSDEKNDKDPSDEKNDKDQMEIEVSCSGSVDGDHVHKNIVSVATGDSDNVDSPCADTQSPAEGADVMPSDIVVVPSEESAMDTLVPSGETSQECEAEGAVQPSGTDPSDTMDPT